MVLGLRNQSYAQYIKNIKEAKIEAERNLREDLDNKILSMRFDRFVQVVGKDSAKRIRFYIRKFSGIETNDVFD